VSEFEFWTRLLEDSRPFFFVISLVILIVCTIWFAESAIIRDTFNKKAVWCIAGLLVLGYGYYVVTERMLFEVMK